MDERDWVEGHRGELVGIASADAERIVRDAGFTPRVHRAADDGSVTIATSYWVGGVSLVAIGEVVVGVSAG